MKNRSDLNGIDVVIVNWNTSDHLEHCLASLQRCVELGQVVIVDNASTDDSLDVAEESIRALKATVIRNESNVGFGRACNQGAARCRASYVLFLNPDTRVRADSLEKVTAFFESPAGSTYAICGVRMTDPEGHWAIPGGPFPSLRLVLGNVTRLNRIAPRLFPARHSSPTHGSGPIDHVIGAFLAIRRSVFEALGGFDQRYFIYYEEVDLCLRARDSGWGSFHIEDGDVVHIGNVSTQQIMGRRLFYSLRSRHQYAARHWTPAARRGLMLVEFGLELPARMASEMATRRSLVPRETLQGYRLYTNALTHAFRADTF